MRIMQLGSMLRYRLFAMHKATRNGFSACTTLQARTPTVRRCACASQRREIACAASRINALGHQRIQAVATSTEPLQKQRNNGLHPKSTASRKLTFQEAITALERYWAEQSGVNCAILLPHNTEVGQADCHDLTRHTFHPATLHMPYINQYGQHSCLYARMLWATLSTAALE